jgi:hypothetical protein
MIASPNNQEDSDDTGPNPIFLLGAGSLSGLIMGILLSGEVIAATLLFAVIGGALILGWWARGIAGSDPRMKEAEANAVRRAVHDHRLDS